MAATGRTQPSVTAPFREQQEKHSGGGALGPLRPPFASGVSGFPE